MMGGGGMGDFLGWNYWTFVVLKWYFCATLLGLLFATVESKLPNISEFRSAGDLAPGWRCCCIVA
jgi:hypothetical protein